MHREHTKKARERARGVVQKTKKRQKNNNKPPLLSGFVGGVVFLVKVKQSSKKKTKTKTKKKFPFLGGEERKFLLLLFFCGGRERTPLPFLMTFLSKKRRSSIKKNWKKNPDKEALRYGAPSPPRERLARVVVFALDDDSDDDASKGWRRAKTRSSASRDPGTTKL